MDPKNLAGWVVELIRTAQELAAESQMLIGESKRLTRAARTTRRCEGDPMGTEWQFQETIARCFSIVVSSYNEGETPHSPE